MFTTQRTGSMTGKLPVCGVYQSVEQINKRTNQRQVPLRKALADQEGRNARDRLKHVPLRRACSSGGDKYECACPAVVVNEDGWRGGRGEPPGHLIMRFGQWVARIPFPPKHRQYFLEYPFF